MKKKLLCIVVSMTLLMGMTVHASCRTEGNGGDVIDRVVPREKVAELEKIALVSEEGNIQAYASSGLYEDNDTIEPALGHSHSSRTNWFAVERDGTIDERPLPYSNNPSCALH